MSPLPELPAPDVIEANPEAILAEVRATFEAELGRTIQASQYEMRLVNALAYREAITCLRVNEAARQNLVAFARFPMLDHLGTLRGLTRLSARSATCTLRFALTAVQVASVLVPTGTRVRTTDGLHLFATTAPLVIPPGSTTGDVAALAMVAGVAANGYEAGLVADLFDPVPFVASATNLATTADGADAESDEGFRERIWLSPEGWSVAGPGDAYKFHALKASPALVDVGVESPEPGEVEIYPLTATGLPSPELMAEIEVLLNGRKLRPLSDRPVVLAPTEVEDTWAITLHVSAAVGAGISAAAVRAEAEARLVAYAAVLGAALGQDRVPERIEATCMAVPGVYRAVLADRTHQVLGPRDWLNVTGITVTLAGVGDD